MTSRWDGKFPFSSKRGELIGYDGDVGASWSPNYAAPVFKTLDEARFTGTLRYVGYSRGRSSALIIFTDGVVLGETYRGDPDLRRYQIFMSDADDVIPLLVKGEITGSFVPRKSGKNMAWKMEAS